MALNPSVTPRELIWKLVGFDTIQAKARALGVIRRERTLELLPFLMVLLFVAGPLAKLRQRYADLTDAPLARSSFNDRFTPPLAKLLALLCGLLQKRATASCPIYRGELAPFRDIIAVDSTVIRLRDSLRAVFKGTTGAAIKVHTRIRALTGELLRHRLTPGAFADCKGFGVDWKDASKLFLLDMAYSGADLLWRIARVRAFFITRLPASYKPRIASVNRLHRGRARGLVGRPLRAELPRLKREVLDVMCTFRVHIRGYAGRRGRYESASFRIVGVWNSSKQRYHLYMTNIAVEWASPWQVAKWYRLRWEVELFYRLGKGILGLDALKQLRSAVCVRILVRAALIRQCVTMQANVLARAQLNAHQRLNPERWAVVWHERVNTRLIFELLGLLSLVSTWSQLIALALDPNRGRTPLRNAFPLQFKQLDVITPTLWDP